MLSHFPVVLVIDVHRTWQDSLTDLLVELGYIVQKVTDTPALTVILTSFPPTCILLNAKRDEASATPFLKTIEKHAPRLTVHHLGAVEQELHPGRVIADLPLTDVRQRVSVGNDSSVYATSLCVS